MQAKGLDKTSIMPLIKLKNFDLNTVGLSF